ncbi:MAG: small subunit ribosomal protein S20 [Patiriisocius sp.]
MSAVAKALQFIGAWGIVLPLKKIYMPITKGAEKANRASLRKRVFNMRRNRTMNEVVKNLRKHIAGGEVKEAEAMLPEAQKAIDKAAKRGIIKGNTADRKKSRLVAAILRAK